MSTASMGVLPSQQARELEVTQEESSLRLSDKTALIEPFLASEKPPSAWRIGTEAEKFGIFADTLSPVQYESTDGRPGVLQIIEALGARGDWKEKREYEGGPLLGLQGSGASVTLEPGGQLELSGAPFASLWDCQAEFETHLEDLEAVSSPHGIRWLAMGFHPTARQDQLPWVPKLRYEVMREYLPTRGSRGLDMMRRTATVQANLDYRSAEDAFRKLRLGLKIQPIVSALFANSPFRELAPAGALSERARVWLDMDPDRSGLLEWAWEGGADYERYVDWALDVPMFLIARGSTIHRNTGQTFRQFMRDGFEGVEATASDWVGHLNTLFPEVRIKNTLEFRTADSVPLDLVATLPALYKGLLYCAKSADALDEMVARLAYADVASARMRVPTEGYGTSLGSQTVGDWAERVVDLAAAGLDRLAQDDQRSERPLLAPLMQLVQGRRSPADRCMDSCPAEGPQRIEDLRGGWAVNPGA